MTREAMLAGGVCILQCCIWTGKGSYPFLAAQALHVPPSAHNYIPDFRMRPWQNVNSCGICDCHRHQNLWSACRPAAYALKPMACVSHEQ